MSSKVLDEPEQLEPIEDEAVVKSNLEFLEDFHGQTEVPLIIAPADEALGNGIVEHSMTELLDGLQDRNVQLRGNPKMVCFL